MATPIAVSSTPSSLTAKDGKIGMRIPKPNRSIKTVRNIKERADLCFTIDYKSNE